MLVTFSTDAYSSITMFGDVAISLLKLMGHSGTVPSAIMAEDVPAALERLNSAIASLKAVQPEDDPDAPSVSIVKRALPLIELLSAAAREKAYVMWQ